MEDNKTDFVRAIKALGVPLQILPDLKNVALIRNLIPIGQFFIKFRPKVILSSGQSATLTGMPLGLLFRTPSRIYIRHHSDFHHRYGLRRWVHIDMFMNKVSTKIVAVSENVRKILMENEGVGEKKIIKIYNGVDLQRFKGLIETSKSELRDFRIGIISKWADLKGVEFTLKAFNDFNRIHPKSFLHYIGPDQKYIEDIKSILDGVPTDNYLIETLNLDVTKFLSDLDVLVHVPIAPEVEAFGLVYIEGLASGKNCIFTISGVLCELLSPDRYFALVPYANSDAILQALEEIRSKNLVFDKISPDWLDQFSLESQGKNYSKLLQSEIIK